METDDGVVVVLPDAGTQVPRPNGGTITYLARGAETNGAFGLMELTVPPATDPDRPQMGARAHRHAGEDEAWYILEGELLFTIGGRTVHASAGTYLFVPRGVLHATVNPGTRPARYLAWFTPPGMEGYFAERAALLEEAGGEADAAALSGLATKYGMELAD